MLDKSLYNDGLGTVNRSVPNMGQNDVYNWQVDSFSQAERALDQMYELADYNSAKSAQQAEIQREWQELQNAKAMMFNQAEAAKNRDWQEFMSNTAHQREVRDLVAAGLNPVLSVNGGNGAAVTSGATAQGVTSAGSKGDVDMSLDQAFVSLLGTAYANQTKLQESAMSAITALINMDKSLEVQKYLGEAQVNAAITNALVSAGASRDVARINFASAGNVADIYTSMEHFLRKNYPETWPALLNSVADELFGGLSNLYPVIQGMLKEVVEGKGSNSKDQSIPMIDTNYDGTNVINSLAKMIKDNFKKYGDNKKNLSPGQ